MKASSCLSSAVLFALLVTTGLARAQPYPNKPIRLIQGFAAGGGSDFTARVVGNELGKRYGQPVVAENRVGANGTIGANAVAKAVPDGYTLFYGDISQMSPTFLKNNGVVMGKDLIPVAAIAATGFVFVTSAKLPAKSLPELIAYAKANPNKLNFGVPTVVTSLMMRVLKERTGISYTDIPYKGGPPLLLALLAGETDFAITVLPGIPAQMQAGTVRSFFFTGDARSSLVPETPTAAEVGIADFRVQLTFGIWAPVGTPRDIIQRFGAEAVAVAKTPQTADEFRKAPGFEPAGATAEELARSYEIAMRFWAEAARLANFEPQ